MRISFTRFSVVAVVVIQWIAALLLISICHKYEGIFKDFAATLPGISIIALHVTKPIVLVPIAMIGTAAVVLAEALLASAAPRIVIQIGVFVLWFAFSCFCFAAISLPLLTLAEKLR